MAAHRRRRKVPPPLGLPAEVGVGLGQAPVDLGQFLPRLILAAHAGQEDRIAGDALEARKVVGGPA